MFFALRNIVLIRTDHWKLLWGTKNGYSVASLWKLPCGTFISKCLLCAKPISFTLNVPNFISHMLFKKKRCLSPPPIVFTPFGITYTDRPIDDLGHPNKEETMIMGETQTTPQKAQIYILSLMLRTLNAFHSNLKLSTESFADSHLKGWFILRHRLEVF